jgi:hypothetical protein
MKEGNVILISDGGRQIYDSIDHGGNQPGGGGTMLPGKAKKALGIKSWHDDNGVPQYQRKCSPGVRCCVVEGSCYQMCIIMGGFKGVSISQQGIEAISGISKNPLGLARCPGGIDQGRGHAARAGFHLRRIICTSLYEFIKIQYP